MEDALDMAAHSLGPESSGPVADAGQGAASEMGPATSKRKMCARTRHDIHVALGLPASAVYQDDYSCALKRRGILLQGRMYVYDTHVAFYSNLLFGSFVTKLVIPVRSITCVSKHSNLGFPNSIKIRRGAFVDTLTSFLSRGAAFELVSRMVAAQQQAREAHGGQEQVSRRTTAQLSAKPGSAVSAGSSSPAGPPSPDGSVSAQRPSSPSGNSAARNAISSPRQQQQQQLSGKESVDRSISAQISSNSSSRGGGSTDGSSSCVAPTNGAESTRRVSSSAVSSCSSLSTSSSCTSSSCSTAAPCSAATISAASTSSLPTPASSLTTSASRCLISWGSAAALSSPGTRKAQKFLTGRWSTEGSSANSSSSAIATAQQLTHSISSPFTCPPLPEGSEPAAPPEQATTTPCTPAQPEFKAQTGSYGWLRIAVVLAAVVSLLLLLLVARFRVGERAYAYSTIRAARGQALAVVDQQEAQLLLQQRVDGAQGPMQQDTPMDGDVVAILRAHAQVILNEFALVSQGLSAVRHELGAVAGQMTAEGAAAAAAAAAAAGCGGPGGCCGGELRCGGGFAGGRG